MSRDGDVALIHVGVIDGLQRAVRRDGVWIYLDREGYAINAYVDVIRPLAVIDAEDSGEVERLAKALYPDSDGTSLDILVAIFTKALREFANPKPPMPDEPKRLGAIVSDGNGVRWIRRSGFGYPWIIADPASVEETVAAWAGIPRPVVILSPGWEADQ